MLHDNIDDALNAYVGRSTRLKSQDDTRLRTVIFLTGTILAHFAKNFKNMAKATKDVTVVFAFSSAAESNKPATADLVGQEYRVKIELSFIHLIFREVEELKEIPSRDYDPSALAILASISAMAHEFTHAIFGHFEKQPTVLLNGVVYEEEFEADRGGGIGIVSVLADPFASKLLEDYVKLKNPSDVLEVGFLSHWLLVTVVSLFPKPILNYPDSSTRALAYNMGLISTTALAEVATSGDIMLSFVYACHLGRKIGIDLLSADRFLEIILGVEAAQKDLNAKVIDDIVTRRAETMVATKF
ncbi:hypothetical protein HLH89_26025 [Rhizobium laguerreae]|uniref:hypothetical protein n=1 Tax=Rhizobium laguerreae TaxID=1076926 RepID=UPI0014795FC3|nr:hypothetical protein [Rhizobium laguerreae]NNH84466.1 hypothetical protein [Rhizobium laguerreae]